MPRVLLACATAVPVVRAAQLALRACGVADTTSVTILTDGDAGLRAIQQQVAASAEHVLDWFHVAMRFINLKQFAKGVKGSTDGAIRDYALEQLERGKWRFWHGYKSEGSSD